MNINGLGVLLRFIAALWLVFFTFNPSGYSYFHWVKHTIPSINPYIALVGLGLIIGWVIYLKATLRSLGLLGISLLIAVCGCLIWLFYYQGWFTSDSKGLLVWVILGFISGILAIGMSWSLFSRRISGQVDIDDVSDRS